MRADRRECARWAPTGLITACRRPLSRACERIAEYLRLSALGRQQGIGHGLPCSGVAVIAWETSESGYPRRIAGVVAAELAGPGRKCSDGTGRHGVVAGFRRPWSSRVPTAGVSRPGGRAWVRLMGDCRASAALAEAGAGRSMGIWLLDNGAIRVMMASTGSEARNPPSRTLPFSAAMASAVFGARRPG